MKILAIRGRNLASLRGDFAVELDRGALGPAGLFAITGPTGAGKSTILDALCLALFDRTPRLMRGGGVPIGRADEDEALRLTAGDVRSLLRRGTAAGHAEVDFLGRDGRRYRARWAVRRARNQAEGRFQPQTVELRDLDSGQALGGTKTETLAAIEDRLGLSFDQFRRSALLPQGDFAAFLKADERERSELLERMTGTEIYGALSSAAYRRAQDEERAVLDLEDKAGSLSILAPEDRRVREEELAALGEALASTRVRLGEARAATQWHEARAKLRAAEEDGARGAARAQAAWADAAGLREELAAVEAAQPLRLALVSAETADAEVRRARDDLDLLTRQADATSAKREVAQGAYERAQESAARAEAARRAARPALDQAKELDTRVGEAFRLSQEAEGASRLASEAQRTAGEELARLAAQESAAAATLAEADGWLLAHPELAPLASEWGRWKRELDRFTAAERRRRELLAGRPALDRRRDAAGRAEQQARSVHQRVEAQWAAAGEAAARAEVEAAAFSAADLRTERVRWEGHRDLLRSLAEAARAAGETLAETRDARDAAEKAAGDRRAAEDEARRALAQRAGAKAALAEADRALAQARLALDLTAHRPGLREGEPCPLCGATCHPWAAESSPVSERVATHQRRVEDLRAALTDLERLEAASRQKAEGAARTLEAEVARAATLSRRLSTLQDLWDTGRREEPGLDLPADVTDASAGSGADATLRTAAERLADLREAEERAEQRAEALSRAKKTLDAARDALEESRATCLRSEQAAAAAADALRDVDRKLELEEQVCRESLGELSPAFLAWDGWRASLAGDPAAFARECEERVTTWNARAAETEQGRERLAALLPRLEGARALAAEKASQAGERAAAAAETVRALGALRAERSALLGGRPTAAVEAGLDEAVKVAAERLDATRSTLEGARSTFAADAARRDAGEAALTAKTAERDAAVRVLEAALARAGLDRETLRARLARDETWIAQRRGMLDGLSRACEAGEAVRRERARQRERHEATAPPELGAEAAAAATEAAEAAAARTEEELYGCRHALDQDDLERAKARELLPRIEAQRRRFELWQGLCGLIGSADGKRFRVFAQSLTLDALLGHANEHLRDLAPRYRLERVPSHDLELQIVDQDMGDEVRGVASLSGGESFLVSMALALGLSSLSSRTTTVGSLFVDEGFGSLDPDTLEVALATLDSLQASGRKVGLISHVQGLAERIGARVHVVPMGGGRSRVEILAGG